MHESLLRLVPQKYRAHPPFRSGLLRRTFLYLHIVRLEFASSVARLFRAKSLSISKIEALIAYLRLLLEEKKLRDNGRLQTLSPAASHAIKARQVYFLNEHIRALSHMGLLESEPVEISHLVLTMAASIRPGSEHKREDCLLSDRAEHLLDTLDCVKNMVMAQELRRCFFQSIPARWVKDPTWLDHLNALMKAFKLFRDSRGISESSSAKKSAFKWRSKDKERAESSSGKSEIQVAKNILRAHSMHSDELRKGPQ